MTQLILRTAAIVTLLGAGTAGATIPGVPGTYSGTVSGSSTDCSDPADEGPFTDSATISLIAAGEDQGLSVVVGTGTAGGDAELSFTLLFNPDGTLNSGGGSASTSDSTVTLSFSSGQLAPGSLVLQFFGVESYVDEDFCAISGTFTLSGSGGSITIVIPEIAPSTILTTPQVLVRSVTSAINKTFGRIGAIRRGRATGATDLGDGFMLQGGSGLAAGDGYASAIGVWASYTYADFENDFAPTAFDGERHSGFGGIDLNPFEDLIIGVAVGYESADQSTAFNSGESQTDGITVLPYVGYAFNDTFSVDVSMGYTAVDIEQFRTFGGDRFTSEVDADRFFWGSNLNGNRQIGNWYLSGSIGVIWAREYQDSYQETNTSTGAALPVGEQTFKLGQWRAGGEAAYTWNAWEPFVGATYQRDYSATEFTIAGGGPQPANDRDDVLFSAGVRYFGTNNLSGFFEYNRIISRENYEEDNFSLLLRYDFD